MSEPLEESEVLDRAQRWARLHANPKLRDRMERLLEGLSDHDQRRVYLCGQRIAGGLPIKVLPPAVEGRKESNGNKTRQRKRTAKSS